MSGNCSRIHFLYSSLLRTALPDTDISLTVSAAGISREAGSDAKQITGMADIYRVIVREHADCLRDILLAIMEHDFSSGAVLWHCSEGKDRCGLVAALLLGALGVSREDIMADYLLTNEVNVARAEGVYRDLLAAGRSEEEAAMMRELFLAKPEYLNASLEIVDGRFGGVEAYLRDGLGLPEATLAAFREAMVE